jgi:cell division protein FtsB
MSDTVLPDDHDARIARLDAMIARAKHLPSLPMLAARLEQLTQTIETLTARVAALEQECEALRARELIQLWEREA